MTTALQAGINAALATIRTAAGETVTYSRGPYSKTDLTAVRGRSRIETADEAGTTTRTSATDWLIETAALELPNPKRPAELVATTPQPGDRITTAAGQIWEVQTVAGDRHARPSDPGGTHTRIHCRQIT
jgi:hypothetical protein